MISGPNEEAHAALGHSEIGEKFGSFGFIEVGEFAFDLRADHDGVAAVMFAAVRAHLFNKGISFSVCEIGILDVGGEYGGLGTEQKQPVGGSL